MTYRPIAVTCMVGMAFVAVPAQACRYSPPVDLNDVRYADTVVVGRIVNYHIVRDQEARRERRVLEARWPGVSRREQRRRAQRSDFLTDYARFEIAVEQVLVGHAGRVLTVKWDNSTFNEPQSLPSGRYLIALRRLEDAAPPLRGPNAAVRPNPWSGALIPLQGSCSSAFIFEETSEEARGVQAILSRL